MPIAMEQALASGFGLENLLAELLNTITTSCTAQAAILGSDRWEKAVFFDEFEKFGPPRRWQRERKPLC